MANFRALTVQAGVRTQIQDANTIIVGAGITTAAGGITVSSSAGTTTLSGAVTCSGAGTALTVTNNATISGTLTTATIDNSGAGFTIAGNTTSQTAGKVATLWSFLGNVNIAGTLTGGGGGANAYTTLTSNFTQPAVGSTVTIAVASSNFMTPNQALYIGATPGTAVPTVVQSAVANSGSASSLAPSFTPTAGNLLVLHVAWGDATRTISTIADTRGNAYTLVGSTTLSSGANSISMSVYQCASCNVGGGVNTVTVTFSGTATFPEAYLEEVSGHNTAAPIDAGTVLFASLGGAGSTLASSGPVTTSNAKELMQGYCFNYQAATGAGSGWTAITNAGTSGAGVTANGSVLEKQSAGAAGSAFTATTPISPAATWVQVIYGINPAPAQAVGGYYTLVSVPTTTSAVVQNRGDTGNLAAGGTVGSGAGVSPAGLTGPTGIEQALKSDFSTGSATTVATNLSFAMAASDVWNVECDATLDTGASGARFQIAAPTGAVIEGFYALYLAASNTTERIVAINTNSTSAFVASAINAYLRVWFRIKGDGIHSGAVTLQALSVTGVGSTILRAGSRLRARAATQV